MDDSNEQKPLGPDDSSLETPPSGTTGLPEGSQTQPAANPSVPTPEQPVPKKKLAGWKLWVLITAGTLLLLGGGAFAYFGYYLPNQPENIIGKAIQNFLLAESFSLSGRADFAQMSGDAPSVEVNGSLDVSTGEVSSFWLDSKFSYSSAVVDAKLRGQDQQLYVNLSGLVDSSAIISGLISGANAEELGLGAVVSQLLSSIEDTWFVLDSADLEVPVEQEERISDADKDKVFDILSGYELFTVVSEEGDQTVNGRQASGYQIELNFEQLKLALKEIASADYETLKFDESLAGDIESELDNAGLEETSQYQLHVWVYDNDKTLAMIRLEVTDEQGNATLSLAFDDYNQPVNVEIPEKATPVEELLGSLFAF